jgi:hypothetical protein
VVGVLVGRSNKGLTVNNVHISNGYVEATSSSSAAIVATVFGGAVAFDNCSVEDVDIRGSVYMGVFTAMDVAQDIEINNCYAKNVSAKCDGQIGLVCGRMKSAHITMRNVYAIVDFEATGTETTANSRLSAAGLVYGVAGDNGKPSVRTIENFFYIASIKTTDDETLINTDMADLATPVELAQITGETAKIMMPSFDYDTIWKTVEGDTPVIEVRGSALEDDTEGDEDEDDDLLLPDDNGGSSNGGNSSNNNNKNDKTDTTETKDNAGTTDATTDDKKGCGSMVGFAGIALVAVLSGAAVMLKKED